MAFDTLWYDIVLFELYYMIWFGTDFYICLAWFGLVLFGMIWHGMYSNSMIRQGMIWYWLV